jgi:hypothetical protein
MSPVRSQPSASITTDVSIPGRYVTAHHETADE